MPITENIIFRFRNNSILVLALGMGLAHCTQKKEEPGPPNILFIMSDDHGYQAISAYGSELIQTPNIDRIARDGAIFTRACVTNALCAPSRAVILTGKHSFVNGKMDNSQPYDWEQPNFAGILQSHGYQTAVIGKIHLDGVPRGFDYSMVLPGQGSYYNPDFIVNGDTLRIEGYCTDIITEGTLDWLKTKRDPDKPFCLLMQQKAPHGSWMPAPEYMTLFNDVSFNPPKNYFDDYEGRGSAAKKQTMELNQHARWGHVFNLLVDPNGDTTSFKNHFYRMNVQQRAAWMAAYGFNDREFIKNMPQGKDLAIWKYNRLITSYLRTVKSVDDGVGEVLDYLKKAGLEGNTIVIYTSDQGFYLGEHGWWDKRFMYEESFRTPLLVRFPVEIKPGTRIGQRVQNLDFAPTFLDYAGIPVPEDMQGESFRELVAGKTSNWRDAAYYTYYDYPGPHDVMRHYGIATERYKLIHFYYDIDEWELYDLETDPREMKNVYYDPAYLAVRTKLHVRLEEARKQYGDSDELNDKLVKEYLERRVIQPRTE